MECLNTKFSLPTMQNFQVSTANMKYGRDFESDVDGSVDLNCLVIFVLVYNLYFSYQFFKFIKKKIFN